MCRTRVADWRRQRPFPAKTPGFIVQRIYKETRVVMMQADTQAFLQKAGLDRVLKNPEEFRGYIKAELARWTKLIKDAGIKAD